MGIDKTEKKTKTKLKDVERHSLLALISSIKAMNIACALYDQDKKAGAWLILGAEIQKALNTLEQLTKQNKDLKEFIKSHVEEIPKTTKDPQSYMG